MPLRVHDPVLFALVLVAALALVLTGFVGVAPNRLLSGRPIAVLPAAGGAMTAGLAALLALLFCAAFVRAGVALYRGVAAVAGVLLLLALAALGLAARHLAASATAATRIAPGAGFWILVGCAALAVAAALQRLGTGPGI
ncbi:MAG TPA: hypothetical protein VE993_00660, partial [Stellaceae bacterium]|nr:hypothetical protein [Stellaceae bacterium]